MNLPNSKSSPPFSRYKKLSEDHQVQAARTARGQEAAGRLRRELKDARERAAVMAIQATATEERLLTTRASLAHVEALSSQRCAVSFADASLLSPEVAALSRLSRQRETAAASRRIAVAVLQRVVRAFLVRRASTRATRALAAARELLRRVMRRRRSKRDAIRAAAVIQRRTRGRNTGLTSHTCLLRYNIQLSILRFW